MRKNNADYVQFLVDVAAGQGLYQAQIFRNSDWCVLDWNELEGQRDTAIFEVKRTDLIDEWQVWIHVQDTDGNQFIKDLAFVLPEKAEPFKVTPVRRKIPEDLEKDDDPEEEPEDDKVVESDKIEPPDEERSVFAQSKVILLWGALKKGNKD